MRELMKDTVESSQLVEETFKFWLNDNQHIRSPFPNYIHTDLKRSATNGFFNWANGLNEKAKDELNDEAIGEKFEEIIFECATELVKTEDERITILYPFLPRIGDELSNESNEKSNIVDRNLTKEGDNNYLEVNCENNISKEKWKTSFPLPL